ncbi:14226_t:CDS:2, partial [Rhizophagus irregularis]
DWLELLPRLNIKSSKSKALITKLSDAITAVASPASSNTAQLWTEKNIAKTLVISCVFFKAAIAISYGDIDDENSCYGPNRM